MARYTEEELEKWPILTAEFGALVNYRHAKYGSYPLKIEEGSGIYIGHFNYDGPIIYVQRPDGEEVKIFLDTYTKPEPEVTVVIP